MADARRLIPIFQPVLSRRRSYQERVLALTPFAYWPLNEAAGPTLADRSVNGYHGTGSAGLTYANPGPDSGQKSIYLNGSQYVNLPAAFATAFPTSCGAQGSMCVWGKADDWVSGVKLFTFLVNANNQVFMQKENTPDRVSNGFFAGGVLKAAAEAAGQSSTAWRWYCMTWDVNAGAGGEMKFYINNAQVGTTQTPLGTWSGSLATSGRVLGASDNAGGSGWLGHLCEAVLFSRALNAAERAVLYAV